MYIPQHQFDDLDVFVDGVRIEGLRGFVYKSTQDKEVIFGRRNKGVAMKRGAKSYEGEIVILESDFDILTKIAQKKGADKDILDFRDITIVGTHVPDDEQLPKIISVKHAEFTDWEISKSNDDGISEVTLPYKALDLVIK